MAEEAKTPPDVGSEEPTSVAGTEEGKAESTADTGEMPDLEGIKDMMKGFDEQMDMGEQGEDFSKMLHKSVAEIEEAVTVIFHIIFTFTNYYIIHKRRVAKLTGRLFH